MPYRFKHDSRLCAEEILARVSATFDLTVLDGVRLPACPGGPDARQAAD